MDPVKSHWALLGDGKWPINAQIVRADFRFPMAQLQDSEQVELSKCTSARICRSNGINGTKLSVYVRG